MTLRSVATFEPKRIFEGIRGSITFAAVATRPVRKSRDSPNAPFLMRVPELGLNSFASQPDINVVFQRREWENIIKDIESAIKKINGPHAGTDWKDKQHFLAEAAKDFRYFKKCLAEQCDALPRALRCIGGQANP